MKYVLALAVLFVLIGGTFLLLPDATFAQFDNPSQGTAVPGGNTSSGLTERVGGGGLVPCGGPGQDACTTCHALQLAQNVVEFIVQVSFVIAALLFAYAGFLFFTSSAVDSISTAKNIFTNTVVGIIIILTAWLLVNVLLHTLTGKGVNPFTELLCDITEQPIRNNATNNSINTTGGTASGVSTEGVSENDSEIDPLQDARDRAAEIQAERDRQLEEERQAAVEAGGDPDEVPLVNKWFFRTQTGPQGEEVGPFDSQPECVSRAIASGVNPFCYAKSI